jgi:hypothetical protein
MAIERKQVVCPCARPYMCLCLCVGVCVCVCERERERERKRGGDKRRRRRRRRQEPGRNTFQSLLGRITSVGVKASKSRLYSKFVC